MGDSQAIYRDPFDILPPPILSHIAKILLVNAQANNKCCPYCEAKMDDQKERLPQWCKDLSSLSMASQYLRFELWTSSLDELALNADENLNRLEDIMTDYMKTFVTTVYFKAYPGHEGAPKSWSAKRYRRLTRFLASIPRLHTLKLNCTTDHNHQTGRTLSHPTVESITIMIPTLACQSSLSRAFPNLKRLELKEKCPKLLVTTCPDPFDCICLPAVEFLPKFLGEGGFAQVRDLSITLAVRKPEPDDTPIRSGYLSWTVERAIKLLRGKFPAVKYLTIKMSGPGLVDDQVYDLLAMAKWVVELKAPLRDFHLFIHGFEGDWLADLARQNGLQLSDHGDLAKFMCGHDTPGWTDLLRFTPDEALITTAVKQLMAIKTLKVFSITHKAERPQYACGYRGDRLQEVFFQSKTEFIRQKVRGVNKVSLIQHKPSYSEHHMGIDEFRDEIGRGHRFSVAKSLAPHLVEGVAMHGHHHH